MPESSPSSSRPASTPCFTDPKIERITLMKPARCGDFVDPPWATSRPTIPARSSACCRRKAMPAIMSCPTSDIRSDAGALRGSPTIGRDDQTDRNTLLHPALRWRLAQRLAQSGRGQGAEIRRDHMGLHRVAGRRAFPRRLALPELRRARARKGQVRHGHCRRVAADAARDQRACRIPLLGADLAAGERIVGPLGQEKFLAARNDPAELMTFVDTFSARCGPSRAAPSWPTPRSPPGPRRLRPGSAG
jgi:hypothetical protein